MSKLFKSQNRFLSLLLLAAIPGNSWACVEIERDNLRIAKDLAGQKAVLDELEISISDMETTCRTHETLISQRGSASATAESCVALKESAAMNDQLNQSSQSCAQSIDLTRAKLDRLTVEFVAPQEEALTAVVDLDRSLTLLQQICGPELKKTRELQSYSSDLLQISRTSIEKAKAAVKNFSDLSVQTAEFSRVSKAAHARCGSSDEATLAAAPALKALGKGASKAVPAGLANNPASTVTGDLRDPKLALAGATIKPSLVGSGENARYPLAKMAVAARGPAAAANGSSLKAALAGGAKGAQSGATALSARGGSPGESAASSASIASTVFAEGAGAKLVLREDSAKPAQAPEVQLVAAVASPSESPVAGGGGGSVPEPLLEVRYLGELTASQAQQLRNAAAAEERDLFQRVHTTYRARQRQLNGAVERLSLAN